MSSGAAVELCAYTPAWPRLFAVERAALVAIFPAPEFRIEHIGSTAVPGLFAKPIIDILLGARSLEAIEARIPAIEAHGYRYRPEFEAVLPHRRYFVKPMDPPRNFHVHAVELDSAFWIEHLLFRDELRARHDRDAYTNAKAPFIRAVLDGAAARRTSAVDPH